MKKVIFSLAAAALMIGGLASCNGNSTASKADKEFGDSLAVAFGQFAGANALQSYTRMKEMQPEMAEKFDKDAFLKGVETVLNADTTKVSYYQGLQMGLQMVGAVNGINNEALIPMSKDKLLKAFKEIYKSDSIGDVSAYYATYQEFMTKVQTRMQERQDSIIAASDEAKKNLADGQAYAAKMLAEGYSKSEDGLVYKIENPGTEPKVAPNDRVLMVYTGKTVDGEVFDTNAERQVPMFANQFVEGFTEALTLVGKGGKIPAVIPAELGYKLQSRGDKIGPNQTLVFDIEVLDINPKSNNQ